MLYAELRKRMAQVVPFNTTLGIEVRDLGDGTGETFLPFRKDLTNHIDTVHASAIFALAEAASGAAMTGAFAPVITSVRPVAASATIKFLKTTKTGIVARAQTQTAGAALRDDLAKNGKAVFDVAVAIDDMDGVRIADIVVAWHVRGKT
ncbi:MAG: hypothetical protein RL291_1923 [Pseudomonadota bacterium]